jgi:D-beta-D-heptose 7-phosphate kinase/D-beta-D-heptose 1-phosphate adenosyltransferase
MPYPSPDRLELVLGGFAGRRVLVLGDLMLDRYVWGDTARISPEAPVPVIEAREETARLGGAANVANNIRALGGEPLLVALTGGDDGAQEVVRLLAEREISAGWLASDRGRPTSTKTRVLARHQQVVRIDREETAEISGPVLESVLERALAALERASVCVISDYGKGVVTRDLLDPVLAEARRRGIPVCVDPKETHFFAYRGVAVITPNLAEAGAACGRKLRTLDAILAAGTELRAALDARAVLITRGEQGMTLFREETPVLHFRTAATDVFDVTGAGDTVVSTIALALAAGADLPEATAISNHAAGLVIREVGTCATSVEALRRSFAANGGGCEPEEILEPEPPGGDGSPRHGRPG